MARKPQVTTSLTLSKHNLAAAIVGKDLLLSLLSLARIDQSMSLGDSLWAKQTREIIYAAQETYETIVAAMEADSDRQ